MSIHFRVNALRFCHTALYFINNGILTLHLQYMNNLRNGPTQKKFVCDAQFKEYI